MWHCVTGPVIHKQIKILLNNPKLFLICKQDCDKFITADTVNFSIIIKALFHAACNTAEQLISGGMSQPVIDRFQTIYIRGQIKELLICCQFLYILLIGTPVIASCQLVCSG